VGAISNTSTTLTFVSSFSDSPTKFTSAWVGLTVSGTGIQANTVISSISDTSHLVMSKAATSTNAGLTVTVAGGDTNDCVAGANNLCVVNGNRYRATPAEVTAEVWISIINGATGIEWFCHDTTSFAYSLGAMAGGAGAQTAASNLTYINGILKRYASVLNSMTTGICSMDSMNPITGDGFPTVASSCSNGILTMATSDIAVPGCCTLQILGRAKLSHCPAQP